MATLSHHPWVFGVIIHGCHHLWAFRVITGGHWRPSPIVTRIITHGCWVHHAWAFGAITHVAITCGHWGPSLISAPRQRRCACLTPIPAPHRVPRGRAVPGWVPGAVPCRAVPCGGPVGPQPGASGLRNYKSQGAAARGGGRAAGPAGAPPALLMCTSLGGGWMRGGAERSGSARRGAGSHRGRLTCWGAEPGSGNRPWPPNCCGRWCWDPPARGRGRCARGSPVVLGSSIFPAANSCGRISAGAAVSARGPPRRENGGHRDWGPGDRGTGDHILDGATTEMRWG